MAATTAARTKSTIIDTNYDWGLLTIVFSLLAFGLVMVFSSSYAQGISGFDTPYYFILRQFIWTGIGLTVLAITASIRYTLWESWSIVLMAATLLGLLMVLPFGSDLYGASRTFFNGSIQPSEPAKLVIIIYISTWLASKGSRIRDIRVGLIPFSILMGFITVLIVFQPDISSAFLIVATALILFFIAGADLKQLLLIGFSTALTFWIVIQNSSYAQARVDKYLASIWNPLESEEWQVRHSVIALTNGGPMGVGVGQGEVYVPLSWSDYIFATIGEEMGLIGALIVVLLFALFAYRGLRTALNAPDNFGMLLATGITSILIMQALLNVAVVVAAAPPTGVTLPFISYGGSSLVTTLAAVGILLSISRYSNEQKSSKKASKSSEIGKLAYARFDFGWGNRRSRVSSTRRSSPAKKSGTTKKSTTAKTTAKKKTTKRAPAKKAATRESTAKRATPARKTASRRAPAHKSTKQRSSTSTSRRNSR